MTERHLHITQSPFDGSNSLADLAHRISVEHEAVTLAVQHGLAHAIACGKLLIKAKAQVPRGDWLPWLTQCQIGSIRTAQTYMRAARSFAELGPNTQRVAHLSLRNALEALADTPSRELRSIRKQAARNRNMLDTPAGLLPSPGRKMMVARNPAKRQWMLAIGPNISRAKLQQQQQAAREAESVRQLQQQRDDLLDNAAALEAEAKKLREDAKAVNGQISAEIKSVIENSIGQPILPYTETYDFQSKDKKTDDKLAKLTHQKRVERLLAARDAVDGPLREIDRGFWGDLNLPSSQPFTASPGWTKVGSPEWLDELFPAWNDENESEAAE